MFPGSILIFSGWFARRSQCESEDASSPPRHRTALVSTMRPKEVLAFLRKKRAGRRCDPPRGRRLLLGCNINAGGADCPGRSRVQISSARLLTFNLQV